MGSASGLRGSSLISNKEAHAVAGSKLNSLYVEAARQAAKTADQTGNCLPRPTVPTVAITGAWKPDTKPGMLPSQ
jgi:hypothetical protein